jgi:hypothetical protein
MREEIWKNWSQAEKAGNQICSMRWIMHMVFLVNYAVDRNVSIRWSWGGEIEGRHGGEEANGRRQWWWSTVVV